jgi:hypothetical protein
MVGVQVARGDSIGLLRVPGETAVLEGPLAEHEAERVSVGQAVTVTLLDPKRNSELQLDGQVTSILSDAAQPVEGKNRSPRLRIEVNLPAQGGYGAELAQGMSGQVRIKTGGEMFWRWGWRALSSGLKEWGVAFNQRPLGPSDLQAAQSDSIDWIE